MANRHYAEIHATHSDMTALMEQIQLENSLARRHMKELEHEKIVLEERKMVGISFQTTCLVLQLNGDMTVVVVWFYSQMGT